MPDSILKRVPPQNIEAEQATLGSMLISPEALEKAAEILRPEDFYRPTHQEIFDALYSMYERKEPIDIVMVVNELKKRNKLDYIGGQD